MLRCLPILLLLMLGSGCKFFPHFSERPVIVNPFPQLSRVAVAPFFNLSAEPAVDGRQFALAYFNELQSVPGFEVVPVGIVENAMEVHGITLASADEARRLAQILGVDAVAIGAVTDFTPYYPPRCGLRVEWYAANPCFHPIPSGYGLPWGTPMEEEIPQPLIFESAMAKARAEYASVTPIPPLRSEESTDPATKSPPDPYLHPPEGKLISHQELIEPGVPAPVIPGINELPGPAVAADPRGGQCHGGACGAHGAGIAGHGGIPGPCLPTDEPVLRHTQIYNGNDGWFTEALASYYYYRNDARFGGWRAYLQRSDDFIRFCCHMHISEMLTARGGAGESVLVIRWPENR